MIECKFKIVKRRPNLHYLIHTLTFLLGVFWVCHKSSIKGQNEDIDFVFIFISVLLFGVNLYLIFPSVYGYLYLKEHQIEVKIKGKTFVFPLKQVKMLSVSTTFMENNFGINNKNDNNRPYGAYRSGDFTQNFIAFYFEDEYYEFQFELSALYSQNKLYDLMSRWRIQNIPFNFS